MATTATVSLKLTCSASGISVSLTASTADSIEAGSYEADVEMDDVLRLPNDYVRLEIHDVPTSRLQEGVAKLKKGPSSKGQVVSMKVPLTDVPWYRASPTCCITQPRRPF